jgi:hypothetical protein
MSRYHCILNFFKGSQARLGVSANGLGHRWQRYQELKIKTQYTHKMHTILKEYINSDNHSSGRIGRKGATLWLRVSGSAISNQARFTYDPYFYGPSTIKSEQLLLRPQIKAKGLQCCQTPLRSHFNQETCHYFIWDRKSSDSAFMVEGP